MERLPKPPPSMSTNDPARLLAIELPGSQLDFHDDASQPNCPEILPSPIWQLAPKKKYVYIWQCCGCGHSGINIMVTACSACGAARCAYCRTTKVQVR
ncbi:hypothetical protein M430DRAFT_33473 [Amorphotheca resinae ATCC 22711]|uniref:Uncharacterized protein n=1 Tax=Amorphotheca resinae ATCC 22711 TaxID=857342 RepID=A0A2T3B792_AMORE|nr:hypothetical protein M430DRAFT_33473 [Amorphotheca resinae ATCC 22711]PSS22712.1 hypothetical protein M430DRAFT_33473 [Amorphotheca resinae ATCC 22711]